MARENSSVFMGNVVREVEVNYVDSRKGEKVTVVNNAIAVQRTQDEVDFIDFTLWGRKAELLAEYSGKGKCIYITGPMRQQTWTEGDKKRSKLVQQTRNLQIIGFKDNLDDQAKQGAANAVADANGDDDIPF